jgi:spore coat protein A, manganese oxidase
MKITRRKAIEMGLAGGGSLLWFFRNPSPAWAQFSPQIQRFQRPFRTPPLLEPVRRDERGDRPTDYYEIVMKKARVEILPGLQTEIWSYNGTIPGPLIRQRGGVEDEDRGRQSVVRFINQLGNDADGKPIDTTIHLHGMASLPEYDGYAEDLIPPEYFKDYIYPNDRAATLWYHDHTLGKTSRNVYQGLAGMYIVEDEIERQLPLPKGEYDLPMILQDIQFASNGSTIFNDRGRRSLYGDIVLVNGTPWPHLKVANRKYRFRVLNASTSRTYQLVLSRNERALTSGDRFFVIGSDGGLLGEPVEIVSPLDTLRISPAERYELVVDFSQYPIGTQVFLRNPIFQGNFDADNRSTAIMRFDVEREEPDDSTIPDELRVFRRLDPAQATRTRTFRFDRSATQWLIDNKPWSSKRVDANPAPGSIEIWRLFNPGSGWVHPVHIHMVDLQLLDRNGTPPRPYERGWKDVFQVGQSETVRVIAQFGTRDGQYIHGKFMMHCHNLVHEDRDMMTQFEVGLGGSSPLSKPARPISVMLPL